MPTLSPKTTPYYGGGQVANPADVIRVDGAPSSQLTQDLIGTIAVDNAAAEAYMLVSKSGGINTWEGFAGGSLVLKQLTGDVGIANPANGNINVLGTQDQISTLGAADNMTLSIPAVFIAPGSIEATTTIATIDGNITAVGDVIATKSSPGDVVSVQATNSDNTNAASNAQVQIAVGGTSAGYPAVTFEISGAATNNWIVGSDNADAYKFKISEGSAIGTTEAITIDHTTLNVGIPTGGFTSYGSSTIGTGNNSVNSIGNTGGTTSSSVLAGSGGIGITAADSSLTINSGTGALGVSIDASATSVSIANGLAAKTLVLGSTSSTSATTINSGSGNTTMVGNVLKTTNPAFLAYLGATVNAVTGNGATYVLGTDALTEVFDRGGNFNTNGTFTAPVTGLYLLQAAMTVTNVTTANSFQLFLNTTARNYETILTKGAGVNDDQTMYISALCDMSATDTATVSIIVDGEAGDSDGIRGSGSPVVTYFCGQLVA